MRRVFAGSTSGFNAMPIQTLSMVSRAAAAVFVALLLSQLHLPALKIDPASAVRGSLTAATFAYSTCGMRHLAKSKGRSRR
jgi:hypothetical protein